MSHESLNRVLLRRVLSPATRSGRCEAMVSSHWDNQKHAYSDEPRQCLRAGIVEFEGKLVCGRHRRAMATSKTNERFLVGLVMKATIPTNDAESFMSTQQVARLVSAIEPLLKRNLEKKAK